MFHDHVTCTVRAGRGGDGAVSFRREAHVPRGGIDGGDGGRGGDVVLVGDGSRRDLSHLRRIRTFTADDGGRGARQRRHGADGDDVEIIVPLGTQVFDSDGTRLRDITSDGDRCVVATGGAGGRGNANFATPTRRAPAFAEIGLPGEEQAIELRLKLMADAALIGAPNAGKSSMLRRISNARPKVGDYPFTTLAPVLGTVDRPDGSQLVVVDVPGLLHGASEGHGMGHEFAHLERAMLLVHLVTMEDDAEDTGGEFATIRDELWAYDPRIAQLPQIVLLTKRDLVDEEHVEAAMASVQAAIAAEPDRHGLIIQVIPVSSATNQGITEFMNVLFRSTVAEDEPERFQPAMRETQVSLRTLDEYRVYKPRSTRRRWRAYHEQGTFRVAGDAQLQKLAKAAEAGAESSVYELNDWLEAHGVVRALRAAGARDGTDVMVAGVPFTI